MRKTNIHNTFNDIFAYYSQKNSSKVVYRILRNGEEEYENITFLELYERAVRIASTLLKNTTKGERVILLLPTGIPFIESYLGCLLAGVIAVPVNLPMSKRRLSRIINICKDCSPSLFLSSESVLKRCLPWFTEIESLKSIDCLAIDSADFQPAKVSLPRIKQQDIAFLQYTSGSTGIPKGVMVSHQNLMHNLSWIKKSFGNDEHAIVASWLPVFHDLGLIGNVLQGIYAGCETILMDPVDFVRKPIRWLKAITKYKVTTTGGPNFAYDLCINSISDEDLQLLDLSSWKFALNGAEVIRPNTLKNFSKRFQEVGFSPEKFTACYGLAESTLLVSAGSIETPPSLKHLDDTLLTNSGQVRELKKKELESTKYRTIVSCGLTSPDCKVKIVDPNTKLLCKENQTGEIWIASQSNALGYWNKETETKNTFYAYLSNTSLDDKEKYNGPFLRTGDIGFIDGEELYLTGRLKEMIIINGQNHFPQDIEQTVQRSHTDLAENKGAVFSILVNNKEQLVIAQEIKRTSLKLYDAKALFNIICEQVFINHDLPVYAIILLKPAQIPLASSGKIQRLKARDLYISEKFTGLLDEWRVRTQIRSYEEKASSDNHTNDALIIRIQNQISSLLGYPKDKISIKSSFSELGLNSIQGVQLMDQISQWLGREVSPVLLYDYSTIEELANYLTTRKNRENHQEGVHSVNEPVAVIGMACRFPGADHIENFWDNLTQKVDAIIKVPSDRWTQNSDDGNPSDSMNPEWGGFVKNIDEFDALFFNISPGEARHMDPQQRLLLEVSYKTIENAGYSLRQIRGTTTGVFIGLSQNDYSHFLLNSPTGKDLYSGTGGALSIAANRISYFYNFKGPSLAIDTACSSSLVATHTAIQSIQNGSCEQALAGGVNLILNPDVNHSLVQANMLSKDGRCKTYDASANGYVRSEGCGLVLLKSLSKAQEDGDEILAVIRGSAVNQDGKSNGLTAPNGLAQQQVIRNALASARTKAAEITYVETHGTGTSLGDPIEVNALNEVYREGRGHDQPLVLGAVKANIGHLESAAGIAGLIKTILCLKNKVIPPQIHFNKPNPVIDWSNILIKIPTETTPWKTSNKDTRKAGVSSFGFGGTNAHIILEEAPLAATDEVKTALPPRQQQLFVLSANEEAALLMQAQQLIQLIQKQPDIQPQALAYNLANHRSHFPFRVAFIAQDIPELLQALQHFTQQKDSPAIIRSRLSRFKRKTAFLFTGGGAQYPLMGKQLYQQEDIFKQAIDQCCKIANQYMPLDLLDIIFAQPDSEQEKLLHRIDYMQPALFAYQYAMYQLWSAWGITPQVLIGHSLGEIVAACVAGLFSLEDGIKLICYRGMLMQSLPPGGAMLSLQAPAEEVRQVLQKYPSNKVAIGVINGPLQTVVSGQKDTVIEIQEIFDKQQVKTKILQVSHASHSPLMQPIMEQYREVLNTLSFKQPTIQMISNISGEIAAQEIKEAQYWLRHLRETVRFSQGVQQLQKMEIDSYIELGPHPVLLGIAGQCVDDSAAINWLPSARRDQQQALIYHSLAKWFVEGGQVDWKAFYQQREQPKMTLPNYPFQRKRFWLDTSNRHLQGQSYSGHPLLGNRLNIAGDKAVFEACISREHPSFLQDHQVYGEVIVAGAFYCEIIQAFIQRQEAASQLGEILVIAPLRLPKGEDRRIQLIVEQINSPQSPFTIYAFEDQQWTTCASGTIQKTEAPGLEEATDLQALKAACSQNIDIENFYENFADLGIHYGPIFRAVQEAMRNKETVLGHIVLPPEVELQPTYCIHPILLDGAFQLASELMDKQDEQQVHLLYSVEGYQVFRPAEREIWVQLEKVDNNSSELNSSSMKCWNEKGQLVAIIKGLHVKAATEKQLGKGIRKDWLYQLQWKEIPIQQKGGKQGSFLIIGKEPQLNQVLNDQGYDSRQEQEWNEQSEAISQVEHIVVLWENEWSEDLPALAEKQALKGLQQLQQLIQLHSEGKLSLLKNLWWITSHVHSNHDEQGLSQSPLWGLARSFQQEHPQISIRLIDRNEEEKLQKIKEVLCSAIQENQLLIKNERVFGLRLLPWEKTMISEGEKWQDKENFRLEIGQKGLIEELNISPKRRKPLDHNEVEIAVRYTGLNFRDVLSALDLVNIDDETLGGECAGVITKLGAEVKRFQIGDEVIAVASGTFAKYINTDQRLVAHKPLNLSLEEAATIPITFLTAWFGLVELAKIKQGERALIHAAAGGVGMAAVQIAHHFGAKVYATASSKKQQSVRESGVEEVFSSRDLSFYDGVLKATEGKRIDIVLNSLTKDFIDRSLDLLGAGGRFIEIGKRDIRSADELKTTHPNISYSVYDIAGMIKAEKDKIQILMGQLIPLFDKKILRPLPYKTFSILQAENAFRYMSRAMHIGKIILSIPQAKEDVQNALKSKSPSTILITGGLGALGLEISKFIVANYQPAHLLLIGRSQPSAEARQTLEAFESAGTRVSIKSVDVSDKEALEEVINYIPSDSPLKTIIHAAAVLDDGIFIEQDSSKFKKVLSPKIKGAWNLHQLTEEMDLDLFILFSSVAAIMGSAGQANYAAANTFLDALADYRQQKGLPVHNINWGPWASVGLAAQLDHTLKKRLNSQGFGFIAVEQGIKLFDNILNQVNHRMVVLPLQIERVKEMLVYNTSSTSKIYENLLPATFGHLKQKKNTDVVKKLQILPPNQRIKELESILQKEVAKVLSFVNHNEVSVKKSLKEMGLDSLRAIELRNKLSLLFQLSLSATVVFDYPTIEALSNHFQEKLFKAENSIEVQLVSNINKENIISSLDNMLNNMGIKNKDLLQAREVNGLIRELTESLNKLMNKDKPIGTTEKVEISSLSSEEVENELEKYLKKYRQ